MPYRCCVPNCRGNYDGGPKVTVFKFPEDEATRKKWLSRIRRHNFTPSSSSRVCHVHFHKDDVIWETQIVDERTGQLLRAPLLKPRLRPHAVPSLLPNCPSYLSKEESRREGPEEKKQRLENEQLAAALQYSLASQKDYENTFSFSSLEELMLRTKEVDLPNEWTDLRSIPSYGAGRKLSVEEAAAASRGDRFAVSARRAAAAGHGHARPGVRKKHAEERVGRSRRVAAPHLTPRGGRAPQPDSRTGSAAQKPGGLSAAAAAVSQPPVKRSEGKAEPLEKSLPQHSVNTTVTAETRSRYTARNNFWYGPA
ncbi:THAP domain-containing protein 11-like [Schistocerca nitens]|uniref:THAP domain-containing protein 11-like n=1 Tax=Schistocerca nitens TaxID=7011 RepID=UPI002117FACE|nr:THAP domain-containing protein 11-like [Schistocerca nitens]